MDDNKLHFEVDNQYSGYSHRRVANTPKAIAWLIKSGLAKDDRSATLILLGIAVALVVVALIFFASAGSDLETVPTGPVTLAFGK